MGETKTTFQIRELDRAFWARVKAKAAMERITINDLIVRLLTEWLKR